MTTRQKARKAIMAEVNLALTGNDLLTVERIFARLSSESLDGIIAAAVRNAIDDASETELALAEQFAERSAEIRETMKKMKEEAAA